MNYKKGPIPLYFQFYLKLKQEIITGDRPAGSTIPTLNQLAEVSGISHGMIRKALELLETEGLITRRPRIGTIVQEGVDRTTWVPNSSLKELHNRIFHYEVRPLSDGWTAMPHRLQSIFSTLAPQESPDRVYKFHFLLISKEDERRRNLSDMFVPERFFAGLPYERLKEAPLQTVLKDLGIRKLKQVLRPWFCDRYASQRLNLPEGTPIFQRTLVGINSDDQPLTVTEQLFTAYAIERIVDIA